MEDNHTPQDPILPGSLPAGRIAAGRAPACDGPEMLSAASDPSGTTGGGDPRRRVPAWLKGLLDLAMVVVLALMYNHNVLGGMTFHEIGGLALGGVCLIHALLNARWIGSMVRRLFARETPVRMKAQFVVSALLAILFLVIVLTGLFINRTLLPGLRLQGQIWQVLHKTASYWAIAVAGVHVGLHGEWVMGQFRRLFRLRGAPKPARVWIARLLAVAVFGWGIFAAISENYVQKLVLVAGAASMERGMPGADGSRTDGPFKRGGRFPADGQTQGDGQAPADGMTPPDGQVQGDGQVPADGMTPLDGQVQGDDQAPADGMTPPDGQFQGDEAPTDGMTPPDGSDSATASGKGLRGGHGAPPNGMRPDGMAPGGRNGTEANTGLAGLPMTLATWLGILALFAVPTHLLSTLPGRRRQKQPVPIEPAA